MRKRARIGDNSSAPSNETHPHHHDETSFATLFAGDTWWTKRRHAEYHAERKRQAEQWLDRLELTITDCALLDAADCGARMLLRVQQPDQWWWGAVSNSRVAADLLRRQTRDGQVPFVAHEFLVDPALAANAIRGDQQHGGQQQSSADSDLVRHRPFLDIEIEPRRLGTHLSDAVRANPNGLVIPLLTECYVDTFSDVFGCQPNCLWLSSHVIDDASGELHKASFHMIVDTALCQDGSVCHVYFQRRSVQQAFVAHFERRLAKALFVNKEWSTHDVDRVVPFVHTALSVAESATMVEPLPKAWIDSGVYAAKHSLRMPLASKEHDTLRPMMPVNFVVDNSDDKGGIEAACITGFDVGDNAVALEAMAPSTSTPRRADQCRAALGALATSLMRLCATHSDDGDLLDAMMPLLQAHRYCEDELRLVMQREEQQEDAIATLVALDPVLANLSALTKLFGSWCELYGVERVAQSAVIVPLPFESGSTLATTSPGGKRNFVIRSITVEQREHEWPIVCELAAEHLRAQRVRLSKAIVYIKATAHGDDIASYYVETSSNAWFCPIHRRQHTHRQFRININQQTGQCLMRCCNSETNTCHPLGEVLTFAMTQCAPLATATQTLTTQTTAPLATTRLSS